MVVYLPRHWHHNSWRVTARESPAILVDDGKIISRPCAYACRWGAYRETYHPVIQYYDLCYICNSYTKALMYDTTHALATLCRREHLRRTVVPTLYNATVTKKGLTTLHVVDSSNSSPILPRYSIGSTPSSRQDGQIFVSAAHCSCLFTSERGWCLAPLSLLTSNSKQKG